MIKVAVLGYGTIGSGVVEVLQTNRDVIASRVGEEVEVKYILDLRTFPGDPNEDIIVHDYEIIKNDPEVRIVVEAMGGVEPACTFAKGAIENGKHFATSNKALIADKGAELIALAKANKVSCLFEASVGGGIPIIRPLTECLTGDVIEEITGIVNGTTNYMMTKMSLEGSDFDDVLKDAQAKGYAEADPTADIEGYDACRKIAILTSLVAGQQVNYQDIHTEGITKISATDIKYAKALNKKIKLLASSVKKGNSYVAMVAPYFVDPSNPLYGVEDVFNAIFVHGNMLGDGMFYGSGAGKLPTASAVVGDVVEIARNIDKNIPIEWKAESLELVDYRELEFAYFIRTSASMDQIDKVFGSVEYVKIDGACDELAFVTGKISGYDYEKMVADMPLIQSIRLK